MKSTVVAIALTCLALQAGSQENHEVTRVVRLVADAIVAETSYEVIDTASGRLIVIGPSTPVTPTARFRSEYNDWTYFYGVMLSGMMRAGEACAEPKYAEYVNRNFDFIFDHVDYFREQWEVQQVVRGSLYRMHRMNMLDDCGAIGSALIESFRRTQDPRALRMIHRIANYISNVQLRNEERMLTRPDPRYMTLWADDLYMSVPFLARMAVVTGERRYFDDAARQVRLFFKRLWNPEKAILHHAWFSETNERSIGLWGRANGWVVMAQTELLALLPTDHPDRDTLLALYNAHMKGLLAYQSASGLWHQLLDDTSSYLETSCTAMFSYGIIKGVAMGWLAPEYAASALRGWRGVGSRIRPDGKVEGICRGTEVGFTLEFYRDRPTPLNDPRGLGAVLLAGSEIAKYLQKGE